MLKADIQEAMKSAMKAGQKGRLSVIRLVLAAIKQREVDERIELSDEQVLAVLDKMVKQRRDSIAQFRDAGREELATAEEAEIEVIQTFMPAQLSEVEIAALVDQALQATGASSMKDMGKVMGTLKPQLQGRADMGAVSQLIKARLAG